MAEWRVGNGDQKDGFFNTRHSPFLKRDQHTTSFRPRLPIRPLAQVQPPGVKGKGGIPAGVPADILIHSPGL